MSQFQATIALLFLIGGSALAPIAARSYNNGLIFYDLATRIPYLPPTVSVSRGRTLTSVQYSEKGSIWSTFGQPCECNGAACGCCAGIQIKQFKFDQKMCANITYAPRQDEAQLEVHLNERPSAKYGISVRNPSPFCIPVMMGVPMAMCVQMSNIAVQGNNLNMCMDFVVRLATTDLFEMHFQCMKMGLDGVMYVDANGQPVIPPGNSKVDGADESDAPGDQPTGVGADYEEGEQEEEYDEVATTPADSENYIVPADEQQQQQQQQATYEGSEAAGSSSGAVGEIFGDELAAASGSDLYAPNGVEAIDAAETSAAGAATQQMLNQSNEATSDVAEEAAESLTAVESEIALAGNEVEAEAAASKGQQEQQQQQQQQLEEENELEEEEGVEEQQLTQESATATATATAITAATTAPEMTTSEAYNEASAYGDAATVASNVAVAAATTTPVPTAATTLTALADILDEEYEEMNEEEEELDGESELAADKDALQEMEEAGGGEATSTATVDTTTESASADSDDAAATTATSAAFAAAATAAAEADRPHTSVTKEEAMEAIAQHGDSSGDTSDSVIEVADGDNGGSDTINGPSPTTTMFVEQLTMDLPHDDGAYATAAADQQLPAATTITTTMAAVTAATAEISSAEAPHDLAAATEATAPGLHAPYEAPAPPAATTSAPLMPDSNSNNNNGNGNGNGNAMVSRRRSTLPHVQRRRLYG